MADGIGGRIARRRQALRMTQEELAARLGVSRATVANWETGKHFPQRKLGLVESVLGIRLEEPEPDVSPEIVAAVRSTVPPERQQQVLDVIRRTLAGEPDGEGQNPPRRRVPG